MSCRCQRVSAPGSKQIAVGAEQQIMGANPRRVAIILSVAAGTFLSFSFGQTVASNLSFDFFHTAETQPLVIRVEDWGNIIQQDMHVSVSATDIVSWVEVFKLDDVEE